MPGSPLESSTRAKFHWTRKCGLFLVDTKLESSPNIRSSPPHHIQNLALALALVLALVGRRHSPTLELLVKKRVNKLKKCGGFQLSHSRVIVRSTLVDVSSRVALSVKTASTGRWILNAATRTTGTTARRCLSGRRRTAAIQTALSTHSSPTCEA